MQLSILSWPRVSHWCPPLNKGSKKKHTKICWALALCIMFFIGNVGTGNAEMFIYPKEGQSKEKQEMDEFQCHKWAVEQTGVDPMKQQPAPVPQAQPQTQSRREGLLRGAGRGAALDAVGGAIAGDAGKGAAIGAGVGALGGAMRRRQSNQRQAESQQQAAQQSQSQVQGYNKAKSACLKGRGYTVE
jgi:hypothetical protein